MDVTSMKALVRSIPPQLNLGNLTPGQLAVVGYLARYTGNTYNLYKHWLSRWIDWCEQQHVDILDVQRAHVEFYVRWLTESGLKASTVGGAMTPVRGFYRMTCIDGIITRDPSAYIRLPKVIHTKRLPLEREEIQRWLLIAKNISPRHWAASQLACIMRLRISEITSLNCDSYDEVQQGFHMLTYVGKGNKPIQKPLPYMVLMALEAVRDGRTTGPLITTKNGSRMTRGAATGLFATMSRRFGATRTLNSHYMGANAITQGFQSGLTPYEVQKFAEHEDLRTTQKHYDLNVMQAARHPVHMIAARLAV
jgi:site-specific recombinase XerD